MQVVYGVKDYKTYAKICLVVRREPIGVVRYCHFGSGNYNESTAKRFNLASMVALNMRERLTDLIGFEAEWAREGKKARICAKVNSLVDPCLIEKL